MSEYKHRLTLAVPEALILEANQLALIAGESLDDVNTFTKANWVDDAGNSYTVCSTISKPVVLQLLRKSMLEDVSKSDGYNMAARALSKVVVMKEGITANPNQITLAIDVDPLQALSEMGLHFKETIFNLELEE
jgi:hypothetical protein